VSSHKEGEFLNKWAAVSFPGITHPIDIGWQWLGFACY